MKKFEIVFKSVVFLTILGLFSCQKKEGEASLQVFNFTPEDAAPGSIMRIGGSGFSTTPSENEVLFGETEASAVPGQVLEATAVRLSVKIPENVPYRSNRVFVRVKGVIKSANIFYTPAPIRIKGEINKDSVLISNRVYLLEGVVRIKSGATLTIEPNVIVKWEKNTLGTLLIEKGAKIIADGKSPQTPIIFTSDQPRGFSGRDFRDGGGILILGNAPDLNNTTENKLVVQSLKEELSYGGNNPEDNSGLLKYVRIEFTGARRELAGLTLAGVGNKTSLEYIQVSYSENDGIKFIGGNVNAKYLMLFSNKEDDLDLSAGYDGKIQYAIASKDSYVSTIEDYADGIEARNSGGAVANFTYLQPITVQVRNGGALGRHGTGVYIANNSKLKLFNSAIIGAFFAGIALTDGPEGSVKNYPTNNVNFAEWIAGNAVIDARETTLPGIPTRAGYFGVLKNITPTGNFEFINFVDDTNPSGILAQNLITAFLSNNQEATVLANIVPPVEPSVQRQNKIFNEWGVQAMSDYASFNTPNFLPALGIPNGGLREGYKNIDISTKGFFENAPFKGAFGTIDWSKEWANFNPRLENY